MKMKSITNFGSVKIRHSDCWIKCQNFSYFSRLMAKGKKGIMLNCVNRIFHYGKIVKQYLEKILTYVKVD